MQSVETSSYSLFNESGELKTREEVLDVYVEAQWRAIKNRLDTHIRIESYTAPEITFNGDLFRKNQRRLEQAGYMVTVYDSSCTYKVEFMVDETEIVQ